MPRVSSPQITKGLTFNQFLYLHTVREYTIPELTEFFGLKTHTLYNAYGQWKKGHREGAANGKGLGLILSDLDSFVAERRVRRSELAAPVAVADKPAENPVTKPSAYFVDETGKMYRIILQAL